MERFNMPASISFLVLRNSPWRLFMRRLSSIAWFTISALLCGALCGSRAGAAVGVPQLNSEITALQSTTTTTINDVNAAFLRIKSETNQTGCGLAIGAIQHTKANTTIMWPVEFVTSTSPITSLQFDASIPSSFTVVSVSTGPADIATGKSVSGAIVNGNERVLVFGLNQTSQQTGQVAVIQWKVGNVPNGLYPIELLNPVASNAAGTVVPLCLMSGIVEVP